jgi:MFS family permease
MLSFNFQVILPLLARFSFDGGPTEYASLMTAMGAGAVAGALITGARGRVSPRLLVVSSAAFGALSLLLAGAPNLGVAIAILVPLGAASVTFAASVNSTLQIEVAPEMRGRVMALYSVVFLGSTPIGGPLAGWVSETSSPRVALVIAGAAALTAALAARFAFARNVGENAADAAADPDRGGHAARVRRAGLGRAEQPGRRAERGRGAERLARERGAGHTHSARER